MAGSALAPCLYRLPEHWSAPGTESLGKTARQTASDSNSGEILKKGEENRGGERKEKNKRKKKGTTKKETWCTYTKPFQRVSGFVSRWHTTLVLSWQLWSSLCQVINLGSSFSQVSSRLAQSSSGLWVCVFPSQSSMGMKACVCEHGHTTRSRMWPAVCSFLTVELHTAGITPVLCRVNGRKP